MPERNHTNLETGTKESVCPQCGCPIDALLAAREAETREQCARMVESKRNEALKRGLDAEWTEPYAELETAIRAHTPTGPGP